MIKQTIAFLLAGGASTGLYFGLLAFTHEWLQWQLLHALTFAYVCAVTFHFFMNRRITFSAHADDVVPQIARYLAMAFLNYLITVAVVWLLQSHWSLNLYFATACAVVATMISGFLLMKRWVFA